MTEVLLIFPTLERGYEWIRWFHTLWIGNADKSHARSRADFSKDRIIDYSNNVSVRVVSKNSPESIIGFRGKTINVSEFWAPELTLEYLNEVIFE